MNYILWYNTSYSILLRNQIKKNFFLFTTTCFTMPKSPLQACNPKGNQPTVRRCQISFRPAYTSYETLTNAR